MERIEDYRNNCVLVAIKEVTGKDDADVLAAVRRHGYKNNDGMWPHQYEPALSELGAQLGEKKKGDMFMKSCGTDYFGRPKVKWKRESLSLVMAKLKQGVWLVRTMGHILVVRDGVLVDPNWRARASLGRGVVDYVQVLNPHVPKVDGFVKIKRVYFKPNTKRHSRFQSLRMFLAARGEAGATAKDVFAHTTYTKADFAWDFKRGNIVIV